MEALCDDGANSWVCSCSRALEQHKQFVAARDHRCERAAHGLERWAIMPLETSAKRRECVVVAAMDGRQEQIDLGAKDLEDIGLRDADPRSDRLSGAAMQTMQRELGDGGLQNGFAAVFSREAVGFRWMSSSHKVSVHSLTLFVKGKIGASTRHEFKSGNTLHTWRSIGSSWFGQEYPPSYSEASKSINSACPPEDGALPGYAVSCVTQHLIVCWPGVHLRMSCS